MYQCTMKIQLVQYHKTELEVAGLLEQHPNHHGSWFSSLQVYHTMMFHMTTMNYHKMLTHKSLHRKN